MAHNKSTTPRNFLTKCIAAIALIFVYGVGLVGASAVLLTASTTSAQAQRGRGGGGYRGGGYRGGGGFRGGGFRGGGYRGRGYGFGPRIIAPGCYFSRRWGRVVCPY